MAQDIVVVGSGATMELFDGTEAMGAGETLLARQRVFVPLATKKLGDIVEGRPGPMASSV